MQQILMAHGVCPAVTLSTAVVGAQAGLTLLLNALHTRCGHYREGILHGVSPHIISKTDMKFYVMKTAQNIFLVAVGRVFVLAERPVS